MEIFGLLFGSVWVLVATVALAIRLLIKRKLKIGFIFRPYVICSSALGAMLSIGSLADFGSTCGLACILAFWMFAWNPISLLVSFMTARRYCWLPFSYVFGCVAYCGAMALMHDCDRGGNLLAGLGSLLGVAFLLASLYTYFDLQVGHISGRIGSEEPDRPWFARLNSLTLLGGIMVVLLALVGVTYGWLFQ